MTNNTSLLLAARLNYNFCWQMLALLIVFIYLAITGYPVYQEIFNCLTLLIGSISLLSFFCIVLSHRPYRTIFPCNYGIFVSTLILTVIETVVDSWLAIATADWLLSLQALSLVQRLVAFIGNSFPLFVLLMISSGLSFPLTLERTEQIFFESKQTVQGKTRGKIKQTQVTKVCSKEFSSTSNNSVLSEIIGPNFLSIDPLNWVMQFVSKSCFFPLLIYFLISPVGKQMV